MTDKALKQRLILIGLVVLAGIALLYPPTQRLKPGLDIAGGFSLIYEIDDTGLEDDANLADNMKTLLQKRVDPNGVYELIWRVHGRNRIEIQMPLPSKRAQALKQEYADALQKLFTTNITVGALDHALRLPGVERDAALQQLAGDSPERAQLLQEAAARYDEYQAAVRAREAGAAPPASSPTTEPATTQPTPEQLKAAERDADEARQNAYDAVIATNLNPSRVQDLLDLDANSPIRKNGYDEINRQHPELQAQIKDLFEKYDAWRESRRGGGALEGPADLARLLRGSGIMEFRILAEPSPENPTRYDAMRKQLQERGPRGPEGDVEGWFKIDNPTAFFDLKSPAELANYDPKQSRFVVADKYGDDYYVLAKLGREHGLLRPLATERKWQLKSAGISRDERGRLCVIFNLDPYGGDRFRELTSANIEKQLCILIDDVAYSSANIQEAIGAQGRITGEFSQDKVQYLVQTMNAGALPARLKETPISERTIGSSLGEENLRKALNSGFIGAIAVVLLMGGYYWKCGMIANVAVFMNIFLTLAIMAMLQARITLTGIAGLILSLGMAVDANVLIHERMREEQERGSTLRMVIKSGYDKAFRAILDGHITTLLTSVIIYYVGSEEIRGFGLMLGWGILLSLFTSVFVTRTLLQLLVKYGVIKEIRMMKLVPVPKIDWYAKRKYFIPLSIVLPLLGLLFLIVRDRRDYLDVEFLGGVSAEIELKQAGSVNDAEIMKRLGAVADAIAADARKVAQANVEPAGAGTFAVQAPGVATPRLAALLAEPLEEAGVLERGGISDRRADGVLSLAAKEGVTAEQLQAVVREIGSGAIADTENIKRANVNSVTEAGGQSTRGLYWSVTTVVTNKLLVQHALTSALGDELRIKPRITYVFRSPDGHPYPITENRLESSIPGLPAGAGGDVSSFRGGAAMWFDELSPPQALDTIRDRFRNMRLQPGYEDYPWRPFDVLGVRAADANGDGQPDQVDGHTVYDSAVIVVADPGLRYEDSPERWRASLADKELALARATLDTEQALRRVSQFKPQIADQSKLRAVLAVMLSWAMIIGFLWIRFGTAMYGISGVVGMAHTVLMALAFVGFAGLFGGAGTILGNTLLIENFKIDMTIIAALLTLIGYGINDTIVTFDRVRELRGRLGIVTPDTINRAINECMSRTLLTGTTVLVVLLAMYIFGGTSLRGFNYCMFIGIIVATYSSIAIAAPLLLLGRKGQTTTAATPTAPLVRA